MIKFGMDYFKNNGKQWLAEDVPLSDIAKEIGTPCYVYSRAAFVQAWQSFDIAFNAHPHRVNFAVKANSNIAVLNILAQCGAGFDIVSMGELARVLKAKGNPAHIVFSGVGKSHEELSYALKVGVGCINVESKSEVLRLNELAIALQKKAPIAFRINPDVDPKSHPYISTGLQENKFGIPMVNALAIYQFAATLPGIQIEGLSFHIGSQIIELSPIIEALDKILILIEQLKSNGITIQHLNVGGGLGIRYHQEMPPKPAEYVKAILSKIKQSKEPNIKIYVEPGRAIAANAGVLLTRVEYIKNHGSRDKSFAIVDAAMNDLIRPAFYNAWQDIFSVTNPNSDVLEKKYDIVGPVCESSDFLGKDRMLSIKEGELIAIGSVGAYGFSMSSNYNSRPRVAEVMVDKDRFQVVRCRETIDDLFAAETLLTN